ncbi:MAG: hypothetical protein ACFE7E_03490 [Candidatus Hodarchaeota archaeon]
MEEKGIEKELEILEIARELGVEEEDVQEVSERSTRISLSVFSGIFSFVLGFIMGVFFSAQYIYSYPYSRGLIPGFILTKTAHRILSVVLGIIGFFSGLAVSIQIPWSERVYKIPVDIVPTYGVFTKRRPSLVLGRQKEIHHLYGD